MSQQKITQTLQQTIIQTITTQENTTHGHLKKMSMDI